MRKSSLYLIYTIVATMVCATLFIGCGQRAHNPLLLRAESLVIDNPDSALTLLETVRPQIEGEDTLLYNLVWAEMYYMQTKTMEDSLLQSISKLDKSMGEEHFLIKELLHSIYLYRHDSIQAAHSRFLDCNSSMGDDFHPYWKCLVNDYIAVIFLNTGAYEQSKIHFDNVLKYARMTGNERNVANAYIRQAIYYHHTNKLDSALHYSKLVLSNENILDSVLLASAQHNLVLILLNQEEISQSHTDILDLLQSSLRYSNGKLDSLITYAVIAQVYYKRDSVDLAIYYQQQVECGNKNIAKLILYKFLRDYYDAREMKDSAYKYVKLYDQMDFICQRSQPVVEVQANALQQAIADAEKSFAEQKLGIITLALIGFVLVVLGWTLYHQRKMGKKTKQIKLQEAQIGMQSAQITELKDINKQVKITITEKEQIYNKKINNANVELSRAKKKTFTIMQQHGPTIFRNFLECDDALKTKNKTTFLHSIVVAYPCCGEEEKEFMRKLEECAGHLTPTQFLICILYREGLSDEEIATKLKCSNLGTFRKYKSEVRMALETSAFSNGAFAKELLMWFDNCGRNRRQD